MGCQIYVATPLSKWCASMRCIPRRLNSCLRARCGILSEPRRKRSISVLGSKIIRCKILIRSACWILFYALQHSQPGISFLKKWQLPFTWTKRRGSNRSATCFARPHNYQSKGNDGRASPHRYCMTCSASCAMAAPFDRHCSIWLLRIVQYRPNRLIKYPHHHFLRFHWWFPFCYWFEFR